jgi:TIR domain-containing protein
MIEQAESDGHIAEADFQYDVCLSFAGEDRPYVEKAAEALRSSGVRTFYDAYEKATLWGKDLYVHLDYVYQKAARYCVIFASAQYAEKLWTNHERQSAQARAFTENEEYLLPVRIDDTDIPGVRPTVGYIDARTTTPEELAQLVLTKLGPRQQRNFLPPVPTRLYERLKATKAKQRRVVRLRALHILLLLERMTPVERRVLADFFFYGCVAELPQNTHISLDLLSRNSHLAPAEVIRVLSNMSSLGIECRKREFGPRDEHELIGDDYLVELQWWVRIVEPEGGNVTGVAQAMFLLAVAGKCDVHAEQTIERLDFGALSAATDEKDDHHD